MTRLLNPFNRYQAVVTTASWLSLLLFGVGAIAFGTAQGAIANPTATHAQQNLPQPRIFEELPPPSYLPVPSSVPTFNAPTSPLPQSSPNTAPNLTPPEREFNFQAPPSPIPSPRFNQTDNLYRVDIEGDSPFLLSQVRQIEPEAFVRQEEGMIQAGIFADEYNAESRVRVLAARGIQAQITPIATGTDAQIEQQSYAGLPSDFPQDVTPINAYFVVIPGESRALPDIAAQVMQLGVTESAVNQRLAPRGPHVAVGPFESRKDADRWGSYLRSVGLDARVYFGR